MAVAITTTILETRQALAAARRRGLTVGLVPTMGALHAGHASLMQAARAETGFVVVSVFVNPAQFGPHEDLALYPRPFAQDIQWCAQENVDLIFHPEPASIYPPGFKTHVEVHDLQNALEGASRPGHFRGVATVVLKLFHIVGPDVAYVGQKDAQQALILRKMVEDLNVPVTIRTCPTMREADGLAMSSRNVYLDPDQRRHATGLYRALEMLRQCLEAGQRHAKPLLDMAVQMIQATPGAQLDYVTIVDPDTLQPIDIIRGQVLIALAVSFGGTRLIDNMLVRLEK